MSNPDLALESAGLVLNVYKEIPWTSHDAVSRVRRILGIRQVGHGGSLDPFANGVLIVCVGRATKLLTHLVDLGKGYRGTLRLGRRTDSGDLGGQLLEERAVPALDRVALQSAADRFVGTIEQIPPMVSAVKIDGQRLYDLARKGVEVERPARRVEIGRFTITKVELPRVDFEVECGKGTYIRTLAEDLAKAVGTVGMIETLSRTHVGPFEIADACRLISPPGSTRDGLLAQAVDMNRALSHLQGVKVDHAWIRRLRQGGVPPRNALHPETAPRPGQRVRLVGPAGDLLAIARWDLLPGPADRPIDASLCLELERVL